MYIWKLKLQNGSNTSCRMGAEALSMWRADIDALSQDASLSMVVHSSVPLSNSRVGKGHELPTGCIYFERPVCVWCGGCVCVWVCVCVCVCVCVRVRVRVEANH